MTDAADWLKHTLGYEFSDAELLQRALTHRSAPGQSNERLEFLGDAVLDVVVSDVIFHAFPSADEGELSRLRAHLVRDASLADLAQSLGLGDFIELGSGEQKSGGHRRESILADALEAIIGAVYLDKGFGAAVELVKAIYSERLTEFPNPAELKDAKTRLQEWLQGRGRGLPDYALKGTSGQAHKQVFEVECRLVDDDLVETASGSSRRRAEQQAAEQMLSHLLGGS